MNPKTPASPWARMSPRKRKAAANSASVGMKNYWDKLGSKDKKIKLKKLHAASKRWLDSLSPKEKSAVAKTASQGFWGGMTPEKRKSVARNKWKRLSRERKKRIIEEASKRKTEYWSKISSEERSRLIKAIWGKMTPKQVSERTRKRLEKMTPEKLQRAGKKISVGVRKAWEKVPFEERSRMIKARLGNIGPKRKKEIANKIAASVKKLWETMDSETRERISRHMSVAREKVWAKISPEERRKILEDRFGKPTSEKRKEITTKATLTKRRKLFEGIEYIERLPVLNLLTKEEIAVFAEKFRHLTADASRQFINRRDYADVAGEINLGLVEALGKWDGKMLLEKLIADSIKFRLINYFTKEKRTSIMEIKYMGYPNLARRI